MEHIVTADIGGRLRRAREHRGLSLHDATRLTKLSINVLQAIERNDFATLPGGMFRKAYVRTLAAELGLDPNEIVRDYCAQFEPPAPPPAVPDRHAALHREWIQQLTPPPRRSVVTLAALAVPAAAWFMLQPRSVGPTAPLENAESEPVALSMPGGASMTLTASAATAAAIAPDATDAPLRIEMAATGWCWVAAETDGERVLYRLVAPGEHVVLEAQRLISLRLGNAGSVTLTINDGAGRSFGGHGEVVELEVTPANVDGLRHGAAS